MAHDIGQRVSELRALVVRRKANHHHLCARRFERAHLVDAALRRAVCRPSVGFPGRPIETVVFIDKAFALRISLLLVVANVQVERHDILEPGRERLAVAARVSCHAAANRATVTRTIIQP